MTERLPPERLPLNGEKDERVERLKQASRLIVTTWEKMPHSAQWHLSLRRTLWRYTREVLLRKKSGQPNYIEKTEEKTGDNPSRSARQGPAREQPDL